MVDVVTDDPVRPALLALVDKARSDPLMVWDSDWMDVWSLAIRAIIDTENCTRG